jgi:hypothetical protein
MRTLATIGVGVMERMRDEAAWGRKGNNYTLYSDRGRRDMLCNNYHM